MSAPAVTAVVFSVIVLLLWSRYGSHRRGKCNRGRAQNGSEVSSRRFGGGIRPSASSNRIPSVFHPCFIRGYLLVRKSATDQTRMKHGSGELRSTSPPSRPREIRPYSRISNRSRGQSPTGCGARRRRGVPPRLPGVRLIGFTTLGAGIESPPARSAGR
jgi:hypothetical protein